MTLRQQLYRSSAWRASDVKVAQQPRSSPRGRQGWLERVLEALQRK